MAAWPWRSSGCRTPAANRAQRFPLLAELHILSLPTPHTLSAPGLVAQVMPGCDKGLKTRSKQCCHESDVQPATNQLLATSLEKVPLNATRLFFNQSDLSCRYWRCQQSELCLICQEQFQQLAQAHTALQGPELGEILAHILMRWHTLSPSVRSTHLHCTSSN